MRYSGASPCSDCLEAEVEWFPCQAKCLLVKGRRHFYQYCNSTFTAVVEQCFRYVLQQFWASYKLISVKIVTDRIFYISCMTLHSLLNNWKTDFS